MLISVSVGLRLNRERLMWTVDAAALQYIHTNTSELDLLLHLTDRPRYITSVLYATHTPRRYSYDPDMSLILGDFIIIRLKLTPNGLAE